MLDKDKLLELIEAICTNSRSEEVIMEKLGGKKISQRELGLAQNLEDIYTYIHGQGKCQHPNWQIKAREAYKRCIDLHLF